MLDPYPLRDDILHTSMGVVEGCSQCSASHPNLLLKFGRCILQDDHRFWRGVYGKLYVENKNDLYSPFSEQT